MESAFLPKGFRLIHRDCVGSTNDEVRSLAENGAADGTIVSANVQTAGRGRNGRTWVSSAGNLLFSMLVRTNRPALIVPQLSFVASLAVAESVSEFVPLDADISCKWPNDVLVGGRKVAGILLEAAPISGRDIEWLVIGIGINIAEYPKDALFPATSICEWSTSPVLADELLSNFCRRFSRWRNIWEKGDFAIIRQSWLAKAAGLGQPIQVNIANSTVSGVFDDLNSDGAMVLLQEDGQRVTITSGDVYFSKSSLVSLGDADASSN
jgi:BirA family transcriptional regulator, biotin operon repressor / biotin---[acetyl-CoA-carboxylase] ligase